MRERIISFSKSLFLDFIKELYNFLVIRNAHSGNSIIKHYIASCSTGYAKILVDFSVIFNYHLIDDLFVTFFDFIEELEVLLGRKVDMVDETAVSNKYFRKELDATKCLIYG